MLQPLPSDFPPQLEQYWPCPAKIALKHHEQLEDLKHLSHISEFV